MKKAIVKICCALCGKELASTEIRTITIEDLARENNLISYNISITVPYGVRAEKQIDDFHEHGYLCLECYKKYMRKLQGILQGEESE